MHQSRRLKIWVSSGLQSSSQDLPMFRLRSCVRAEGRGNRPSLGEASACLAVVWHILYRRSFTFVWYYKRIVAFDPSSFDGPSPRLIQVAGHEYRQLADPEQRHSVLDARRACLYSVFRVFGHCILGLSQANKQLPAFHFIGLCFLLTAKHPANAMVDRHEQLYARTAASPP
jgi:hypothetical protein